ncbi:MAG TPA: response regulator [Elusimicrobiota bacterium]|jgi:CheY-like chemotaxis protein|nr:response regulator [Elusimicrobiota bacterium]
MLARLLVIDDELGIRDMFSHLIGGLGHEVVTVSRGREAVKRAGAKPFDIVFCDMMMPGMNGFEVLDVLKKSHRDLPVVIMTGYTTEETESEAKMLGAFAFVTKPFEVGEIEDLIARALALKKGGPGAGPSLPG